MQHFTIKEISLIKKHYPKREFKILQESIPHKKIKAIRHKANLLGCKIIFNFKLRKQTTNRRYNIEDYAKVIESYINNPDLTLNDLSIRHNVSYTKISDILSMYFAYRGLDSTVLVLRSAV